jgi:hypothetical protein
MYEKPEKLAEDWGTEVEGWMLWEQWSYVGCAFCQDNGPTATCWGVKDCHGYKRGCGCERCMQLEAAKTEEVFKERSFDVVGNS